MKGLKPQHVSIPQHTKAVAFELVQFSYDLTAELRFQMRDENTRRLHRQLVEFLG